MRVGVFRQCRGQISGTNGTSQAVKIISVDRVRKIRMELPLYILRHRGPVDVSLSSRRVGAKRLMAEPPKA
ncbi:hypothetical protein Z946_1983 [Sulfitobacter noctilucicola]|uniref:Uncharacterized protein n=1 Tax=Sulfitobacter noctilucicola TaxID=1342301 RepID=A0A7W6M5B3_9RHOB|nr:hypothetical protein Z946_1983 [Sulfitobacter noctilucicola]MBB4172353.1 hypothetical protein [Sulfitobacter noctilucicola]